MSLTEEIEQKFGFKIDELNTLEKDTYFKMLNAVSEAQLTPEKLKEYIVVMRDEVEKRLIEEPEFKWRFIFRVPNRQQIFLKARLQNYRLLESFLMSEQKARKQLEDSIKHLGNR